MMDKATLLIKLREYTLLIAAASAVSELLRHYSNNSHHSQYLDHQESVKASLVSDFVRSLALINAEGFTEFDDYIREESINLIPDKEVLPLLVEYVKAGKVFNEIVERIRVDNILSSELIDETI